jgi:polyisoprenoid-binding protein YceI
MNHLLASALVFLLSVTAGAAPVKSPEPTKKILDLSKSANSVEFLAIGWPSKLKVRGVGKAEGEKKLLGGNLVVSGESLLGKASFPLDTLDTGIALRNRHMKETYLETAKFPNAEIEITELKIPEPLKAADGEAPKVPFVGKLTIHGVTTEVRGTVDLKKFTGVWTLNFNFGTKITAFGIKLPSFMGVTVAEDVEVTVKVEGPLT